MSHPILEIIMPLVAVITIVCVAYILTSPFENYDKVPDDA